jgi:hypothetical protein
MKSYLLLGALILVLILALAVALSQFFYWVGMLTTVFAAFALYLRLRPSKPI